MATQNLFEKYGIKEVADVTFYRIEKKEETYESQRNISVASILKSSLTKRMVYPLDDDGRGTTDGYEAYVFDNAQIINGYNYDCDDLITVNGSLVLYDKEKEYLGNYTIEKGNLVTESGADKTTVGMKEPFEFAKDAILTYLQKDDNNDGLINLFGSDSVLLKTLYNTENKRSIRDKIIRMLTVDGYSIKETTTTDSGASDIEINNVLYDGVSGDPVTFGETDFVVWQAELINPKSYHIIGEPSDLKDEFEANGGEITIKGSGANATITSAKLNIIAPYDASGDEIREKFGFQHQALNEATGMIWSFSQPVMTGEYKGKRYSGSIVFTFEDGGNPAKTYDVTLVLNEVEIKSNDFAKLINNTLELSDKKEIIENLLNDTGVTISPDSEEEIASVTTTTTDGKTVLKEDIDSVVVNPNPTENPLGESEIPKFLISFTIKLENAEELETGIYEFDEKGGHYHMDRDREVGTHEFTYAEQVCMHFAKSQNLITKSGTRYHFENANDLFESFDFNDKYAIAPYSSERVVVVGMAGKTVEELYDFEEIDCTIKKLKEVYSAKAYEVVYDDYAELVVEDEMGYYLPQQLGYNYSKRDKKVTFFADGEYSVWAKQKRGIDVGILSAVNTWGDNQHYSINDAIDALKQEKQLIDAGVDYSNVGFDRAFGGYKVTGKAMSDKSIKPYDDIGRGAFYNDYEIGGERIKYSTDQGTNLISSYALESVLDALTLADLSAVPSGQLRITATGTIESNRAIYVHGNKNTYSNRAYIYLLKNVSRNRLATDSDGIFEFNDKKGNKLFYQDKVFAGIETLALVVIGTYGLVFVVNRYGKRDTDKIAWMVNDGTGFINDKEAERLVNHGLIHTVDVTINDETFEATCTVKSLKVRRIVKKANHYIPVLFLDTLKVSTIEQTAEEVYATGGKGNANLIGWDYGKEITLNLEDALFTPASMSAIFGSYDGNDFRKGVKETKTIDRMEKVTAKRNFIVPAGNSKGTPTEADKSAQAVFYDPNTMEPYADGTPIAEGEIFYKFTRSVAYEGSSIGKTIEISADKFPGTYKVVGDTFVRSKETGEDERFQFVIPQAKMTSEQTITLEADGDPSVFDMNMTVLRPDDGVMVKFIQYDVVENEEENDGSTMVKNTENLNLLDDAELFRINDNEDNDIEYIGATEY